MTQHPSSKAAQQITSETELSRRRETIQEWCIFFFGIPTDPLLTYKGRRLDKTPFGWSCASSLGVAYSAMPKEACSLSRPIFVGPSVSQSHSTCFSRGEEKKHESACSSHLGSHTALMAAAQLQVGSPCRRTQCALGSRCTLMWKALLRKPPGEKCTAKSSATPCTENVFREYSLKKPHYTSHHTGYSTIPI